jgi:hypothetical protein
LASLTVSVAAMNIKKGDIVKHEEAPCEVLYIFGPAARLVAYIMNKRTLNGSFIPLNELEFVRRPTYEEFNRK